MLAISHTPPQDAELPPHLREPDPHSPAARIFTAARSCFAREGFSAASTRAIAEAAGMNQALVHYYFGSKAALYQRVLAVEIQGMLRHQLEGRLGIIPMQDLLPGLPGRLMEWFQTHPETADLLRREIGSGGAVLREIMLALGPHGPLGVKRKLAADLRANPVPGPLGELPVEHVLAILLSLGYGMMLMSPLFKDVLALDLGRGATRKNLQASLERVLAAGLCKEDA